MTKREWLFAGGSAVVVALVLVAIAFLDGWNLSTNLAVAGLYVSLAGFAVAITEIRKTTTATRAAQGAIDETVTAIAAERFLLGLTRLRQSGVELDQAIGDRHVERARRALMAWSDDASTCGALVARRLGEDHALVGSLSDTARRAREVKAKLYVSPGDAEWQRTADCLQSMEKMADRIAPLQEQRPTMELTCPLPPLTPQAAAFCSGSWASSQVFRTSLGVL